MSNSIDQHIVGLDFDTSKFDKGIAQAESGLSKFQAGLNDTKSVSALSKVERAISKVGKAFGPIGSAVQAGFSSISSAASNLVSDVSSKLSMLGTIGKVTFAGMTAAVGGMIASGGIKRAMNIEQAKFQLRGLGADVDEIMSNVNDAVTGTAYSLDQAAVVAAQLTASGIQAGDGMTKILKGVAGVAAMTGRDFADIGHIFTTVAGQGKLMTMQLRQLELSGINAAAKMADMWNITEEEVRDMVTKGEVSFEMFSSAMSEAFGEHATKANETFTGSLSNVKAALSRIGEKFATPGLEHLRDILNALRPVINDVSKAIDPFVELFKKWSGIGADGIIGFFTSLDKKLQSLTKMSSGIQSTANVLDAIFTAVGSVFSFDGKSLSEILDFKFLGEIGNYINHGLIDIINTLFGLNIKYPTGLDYFNETVSTLAESEKPIEKVSGILGKEFATSLYNIGTALGLTPPQMEGFFNLISDGEKTFKPFNEYVENVQAGFKNLFGIDDTEGKDFLAYCNSLNGSLEESGKGFKTFFESLKPADPLTAILEGTNASLERFSINFALFKKDLFGEDSGKFSDRIREVAKAFYQWAHNLQFSPEQVKAFSQFISSIKNGFKGLKTIALGAFDGVVAAVGPMVDFIVTKAIPDLVAKFNDIFGKFSEWMPSAREIADALRAAGQSVGDFFTALKNGDVTFLDGIKDGLKNLFGPLIEAAKNSGILSALADVVKNLFSALFGPHDGELTFGKVVRQALDFFKEIPHHIIEGLKGALEAIKTFMDTLDITVGDVFGAINTLLTIGFLKDLSGNFANLAGTIRVAGADLGDFLKTFFKNAFGAEWKSLKGIGDKFTNFIKQIDDAAASVIRNNFPSNVLKIAGSIAILAGALWLLSNIEAEKLVLPMIIIGGLFGGIISLMESLESTFMAWDAKKLGAFASVAAIIVALATSMLMMSAAIWALSRMDPYELMQGLVGVAAAMYILYKAVELLADLDELDKKVITAAFAMAGMASALLLLTAVIEILGHTDLGALIQGFVAMTATLGVMVGALVLLSRYTKPDEMLAGAFAMAGIASALLAMAVAMKIVGSMSFDQLAAAIVGLGGALLMIGLALEALASMKFKPLQVTRIAILLASITGVIATLSLSLALVSSLGLEGVGTALLGLVVSLYAIVGAIALLGQITTESDLVTSAATFAILSLSLIALAQALSMMGALSLDQMGVALLGLGAGLLFLGIAMQAMKNAWEGAISLTVAAAGIVLIASALTVLSAIPIEGLVLSLVGLGVAIAVFAGAAAALSAALPAMLALGTAIAEIGVGALGVGAGILALVVGLMLFLQIVDKFTEYAPKITDAIRTILQDLASLTPEFAQLGVSIITALLSAIEQLIPQFVLVGVSIVIQLMQGLTTYIPVLVELGYQMIITFVNSLAETIRSQHDAMYEAGKNLFLALLEAMLDTLGHLATDLGGFIMDLPAIISGEKSLFESAGSEAASGAVTGAQNQFAQLPDIGANGMEMFFSSMGGKIDNGSMASMFAPISENASLAMSDLGSISEQGASDFKLPWENIGSDIDLSSLGTSMTGSLEGVDFGSVASGKMSELLAPFQDTSGMSAAGVALGEAASSGFDQGAAEMVQNADSKTGEAVSSVDSHSGSANSAGYSVGSNIGSGIYYGIDAWVGSVANKAAEMVRAAKAAADAEAASASPSKEMIKRGKWFGQGFEIGIRGMIPAVAATSSDMVAVGKSAIGDTYSLMSDYVRRIDWDVNPTIRPVLDLTDVQSGMSQLQGIMSTYDSMRIGAFGRIVGTSTEGAASNIQNAPTYNFNLDYSSGDDAVTMFMELASMMQSFNRLEA